MNNYLINGGKKLKGEVVVNASKNSAVAILIASLLNKGKTTIPNLPKIEEVYRIIEVLKSIGVQVVEKGEGVEITPPKKLNLNNINMEAAKRTRSMILLIGVLTHYFKKFSLPFSGGCKLGRRTIMPHLYALENFGVKIKMTASKYNVDSSKIHTGGEFVMYESGDTATENAILAAVLIPGKTVIKFVSANYMVQDLCRFLGRLGVKMEGAGSTTLTIHGKKIIKKDISYDLLEDPIEAMFFITTAAVTGSAITIKRCPIEFLELELYKFKKMGFRFNILREYKAKNGFNRLVDIKTILSVFKAPVEKIDARPFPGLNIDNLPFFVPIAVQAKGETLIHDWVYENRAFYYTELRRLGADIELADPHRVFIKGPTKLTGADIECPPALRPSAIILVAMLGAKGKSVLRNTYTIERGYGGLCERLRGLGADIKISQS